MIKKLIPEPLYRFYWSKIEEALTIAFPVEMPYFWEWWTDNTYVSNNNIDLYINVVDLLEDCEEKRFHPVLRYLIKLTNADEDLISIQYNW